MSRLLRALLAVLTLVGGVLTLSSAAPAAADQGHGNPVLRLSTSRADAGRVTDITVTGTDYLVPPHAEGTEVFGGVYVFFGWVANGSHFGPSIRNSSNNDGTYATTYAYPGDGGDPGTRDPGTGTMRLVSFTSGGESGTATDFHMDAHGNWSTNLRIYGSTFTVTSPTTGETRTYDCQQVQCGVFTMGAHGKASATNEVFVPISFTGKATPTTAAPVVTQPTAPPATVRPGTNPGSPSGGSGQPGASTGVNPSDLGSVAGTDAAGVDGEDGVAPTGGDEGGEGGDGASGASAAETASEADLETAAIGVRSVRSTGGGNGPVVIGLVVVAAAGAGTGAVVVRRRRRRLGASPSN